MKNADLPSFDETIQELKCLIQELQTQPISFKKLVLFIAEKIRERNLKKTKQTLGSNPLLHLVMLRANDALALRVNCLKIKSETLILLSQED